MNRKQARINVQTRMDVLEPREHLTRSQIVGYLQGERMGTLDLNKVDWSALTQVNYFTMLPTSAGVMPTAANDAANLTRLDNVVAIAHAHGVKVVVTIGGAGQDGNLQTLISDTTDGNASGYNTLSSSLNTFQTAHHIDGVDFDWEPLNPTLNQINNYGKLIQAVQAQTDMSVSAAVNPELLPIQNVDDGGASSRYVLTPTAVSNIDQIGIMAYDFATDVHSPWQRSKDSLENWKTYVTSQGQSAEKLLFGVPFYGRAGSSWAVDGQGYGDIVNKWLGDNPGMVAPVNNDSLWAGLGGYPGGAQWSFNGPNAISSKTGLALDDNVGGVMIWDLTLDHLDANKNYDQYSLLPGIRTTVNARGTLAATAASTFSSQRVTMTFNSAIDAATLGVADLDLTNLTTGAKIDAATLGSMTYNATSKVATWTFAVRLPDGNYRATLRGGAVRDGMGNALKLDASTDFFILTGDANHDRAVNFSDLVLLAQNYNGTGKTYGQGDFNGDGKVDFSDLVILAQNYNKTLVAPAALVNASTSKRGERVATGVLS